MDPRHIIQQSLDHIEDNLQTEISAAELAQMAGFSLFHYYRLFQHAAGFRDITPEEPEYYELMGRKIKCLELETERGRYYALSDQR